MAVLRSGGSLQVVWGPRLEEAGGIAERVWFLLGELEAFLGFVDAPLVFDSKGRGMREFGGPGELEELIEGNRLRDSVGAWRPGRGYGFSMFAWSDEIGRSVSISVNAGSNVPVRGGVPPNDAMVEVREAFPVDAFRGFAESNLCALVEAFEPTFGWAASQVHVEANPTGTLRPRVGALTYVGDELGWSPVPLEGVEQERHGEGTLLRLAPGPGERVWEDRAVVDRALASVERAGGFPSLYDAFPPPPDR